MPFSPMTAEISARSTIVKACEKLIPTKDSKYFTKEGNRRPTDARIRKPQPQGNTTSCQLSR